MHLLASLVFFTRLPFWRIREIPAECFKHVVPWWPSVGILTGGIMALTYLAASYFFPNELAILFAIVSRLFATGCLHEDGLADCFDAFGGGTSRERTLAIMKDSRIGSYGVIGLIIYFLCLYTTLETISSYVVALFMFCGDIWGKFIASHIINVLPYARKEEESKAHVVYSRMSRSEVAVNVLFGLIPIVLITLSYGFIFFPAFLVPVVLFFCLTTYKRHRIQGYTGDCCGFLFLLSELSFLLALNAISRWII